MIAKDNDTGLGTVWVAISVRFNDQDAHRRNGFGDGPRPSKSKILFLGNALVDVVVNQALFFFVVRTKPGVPVWI